MRLRFPHPLTLLVGFIALVALLSWVVARGPVRPPRRSRDRTQSSGGGDVPHSAAAAGDAVPGGGCDPKG